MTDHLFVGDPSHLSQDRCARCGVHFDDHGGELWELRPTHIVVSPEAFAALTELLEADPVPNPKLAELLSKPTMFDHDD